MHSGGSVRCRVQNAPCFLRRTVLGWHRFQPGDGGNMRRKLAAGLVVGALVVVLAAITGAAESANPDPYALPGAVASQPALTNGAGTASSGWFYGCPPTMDTAPLPTIPPSSWVSFGLGRIFDFAKGYVPPA